MTLLSISPHALGADNIWGNESHHRLTSRQRRSGSTHGRRGLQSKSTPTTVRYCNIYCLDFWPNTQAVESNPDNSRWIRTRADSTSIHSTHNATERDANYTCVRPPKNPHDWQSSTDNYVTGRFSLIKFSKWILITASLIHWNFLKISYTSHPMSKRYRST